MSTDAPARRDLTLVTRAEYPDGPARIRKAVGATLLFASVPLLIILALAGVDPRIVLFVVGADITAALTMVVLGQQTARRASVRLGLSDGQILIGTEEANHVVRPLTDLTVVDVSDDESAETRIAPAEGDLRVNGMRYLQLTFRDNVGYRVAVLESDPVFHEILQRLRHVIPEKPRATPRKPRVTPVDDVRPTPTATAEPPVGMPSASPAADARLWEAARVVHGQVLSEYGAYELDPALYLRYPGVTDITREPVMDFHTALQEAQALATEAYPNDAGFAGRYRSAVDALRRQWTRCERDGKVTGTSYLADDDRSDLDTAAKLYKHAQSTDQPGEKTAYLRKVQQIVVDLDGRGRVHLPRPVVAAIESQVRLALEPGTRSAEGP